MMDRELTAEELYQKKIRDEFERLKNLPKQEKVLTEEQIQAELKLAKEQEYENKVVALIRQKYNVNQELAILRQRDTKPEEWNIYNEYVESCKRQVKEELGLL